MIAHLDRAKGWRYRVDGGETRVLAVSQSGLASIEVTGARLHTITVS